MIELSGERRIHVYDTHDTELNFPFGYFSHRHAPTKPDLSMSFPDAPLLDLSDITFHDLALIAEVKPQTMVSVAQIDG